MESQEPDPLHHPSATGARPPFAPLFFPSCMAPFPATSPIRGQFTAGRGGGGGGQCWVEQAVKPCEGWRRHSSIPTSHIFLLLPTRTPSACSAPAALLPPRLSSVSSLAFIQPLPTSHPPTLTCLDFLVATCSCSALHPQGSETQKDLHTHTSAERPVTHTRHTDRPTDTHTETREHAVVHPHACTRGACGRPSQLLSQPQSLVSAHLFGAGNRGGAGRLPGATLLTQDSLRGAEV